MTVAVLAVALVAGSGFSQTAVPASATAKAVGEIKSITGGTLVLATDDGKSVSVSLPEGVRVLRIAPGATDLKNATAITPQDLQVGDRVLARGKASEDAKSIAATIVVVMKQSDVAARQQQEREDWQKRGIGGLVSAVDPAAETVTISVTTFAGTKSVLIKASQKTVVRRYAANSVKFDDAKPSNLTSIHPGDQLRARGTKNEDGTEFAAEEIVSGRFRNIAGTVTAISAADNSLTVMDLLTKQPVTVNVAADSKLRKLPQMMAQRIAMRLKGQTPEGTSQSNGSPSNAGGAPAGGSAPAASGVANGGSGRGGGDLQQILSRLPTVTLSDFQKGDAVILVSTEGSDAGVTAITMVGGVEPILTASPGSQAMVLSPWSLSGGQADSQ
jgi:co-chaperonin GroES (HSP10)